jgi:Ser/Thr protein kinase RdoA (MazF antagonist)
MCAVRTEPDELAEVLECIGMDGSSFEVLPGGQQNSHWKLVTSDHQKLVLRRYSRRRTVAAIMWEHRMLLHATANGWPVAAPIVFDGRTILDIAGLWSVFPFLEGTIETVSHPAQHRIRGALLFRLHDDFKTFETGVQRPGFGRVWELDQVVIPSGFESFNDLLKLFGEEHGDLARQIQSLKYRNLRELARLGYGDLPSTPIHGDFNAQNLLFSRGELTGLLDLDSARCDARICDLAQAIWLDCLAPPAFDAVDPASAGAMAGGYAERYPVSETEVSLVAPLIRSAFLSFITLRLLQWADDDQTGRPVASIHRTLDRRVPELESVQQSLESAIHTAVERAETTANDT